jgi:integrase
MLVLPTLVMIIFSVRGHITCTRSACWAVDFLPAGDRQPGGSAFGRRDRRCGAASGGEGLMASIERRVLNRRDGSARVRRVVRYKLRYRDPGGRAHSEAFPRRDDAERRRTEIEASLVSATWLDPHRGEITLVDWARDWLATRHDLRATTWARLETTMERQVLPRFGSVPLLRITNAEVRGWVRDLLAQGLSAATVRKAVFALRQCLAAAVADGRLTTNPADAVPLPTERPRSARYLSQPEVEQLVAAMPRRYQALVLIGAYAGLRWGEAAGLRRRDVDPPRSRIRVMGTAVQIRGVVTLDNEPKTTRSRRTIPVARSVMARIEQHLEEFVGVWADDLVFTAPTGGPLFRAFTQTVLRPAVLPEWLPAGSKRERSQIAWAGEVDLRGLVGARSRQPGVVCPFVDRGQLADRFSCRSSCRFMNSLGKRQGD